MTDLRLIESYVDAVQQNTVAPTSLIESYADVVTVMDPSATRLYEEYAEVITLSVVPTKVYDTYAESIVVILSGTVILGPVVTSTWSLLAGTVSSSGPAVNIAGEVVTSTWAVLAGERARDIAGVQFDTTWTMPSGTVDRAKSIDGEVFSFGFTMLAGSVELPKLIAGEVLSSTWVMLAGTVDRSKLVYGEVVNVTFTMLAGIVSTTGAKLIPGLAFAVTFTMQPGQVATGRPIVITPTGPAVNRLMKFTFAFRAGTVQHIAAASVTGQPITSTWTMIAGSVYRGIQGASFDHTWIMPAGELSHAPPVVIFGKTFDIFWAMPAGTVKLLSGSFVDIAPYAIEQYQDLSGRYTSLLAPPTIPSTLAALPDPNTAPTLTKTAGGFLLAGTYRYAYAGWRGDQAQVTAPSPWTVITVANGDKVTMTHPTIPGAEGYLVYREQI